MKQNFYTYCILNYKHSALLDENINLGVLIYFSSSQSFVFNSSHNLNRIKSIYKNVPEKAIKHYLIQIQKSVSRLRLFDDLFFNNEYNEPFDILIKKNILPVDESSLQFTKSKTVLLNDEIEDVLIEEMLTRRYLVDFDVILTQNTATKEPQLLKKFYGFLEDLDFEKINQNKQKFYKDYVITNESGNTFKFDYGWQNGTLNLVKPISFDLKDSKNIADKAYRNFGQFYDLENEAIEKELRYDLLIAKPHNKDLFAEFDHSLKLLSSLRNSDIILEDEIENYSKKAILALIK